MVEGARRPAPPSYAGGRSPTDRWPGAYYRPTLITDAAQDSEIVQQEIFGPVLVCLPFDTDDQALAPRQRHPVRPGRVRLDNNVYRAGRASREIQAGCVWINDHIPIISEMPHGGYKTSGFGKDMSAYSFDEYTNVKRVMSDITGASHKGWHDVIFTSR